MAQGGEPQVGEQADEVADQADDLLHMLVGEPGHTRQRIQVGLLVEPEAAGALSERLEVHLVVVVHELTGVDRGQALLTDDQREGGAAEAVGAPHRMMRGRACSFRRVLADDQVAAKATGQSVLVRAVEACADLLPPRGYERRPLRIEEGQSQASRGGQPVEQALEALDVDEFRQTM